MVGRIALPRVSSVATAILRGFGGKAAQAERRHEIAGANIDDRPLLLRREPAILPRHGQKLIRPHRGVVSFRPINHIEATVRPGIPKPLEALATLRGEARIGGRLAVRRPVRWVRGSSLPIGGEPPTYRTSRGTPAMNPKVSISTFRVVPLK